MQKKFVYLAATGLFVLSTAILPLAASAETESAKVNAPHNAFHMKLGKFGGKMMGHPFSGKNGVMGTVTMVSGSTITLTDKKGTAYTVDASAAKFPSGMFGLTEDLASIKVGDIVSVHGTVSGTNVTADMLVDRSFIERTVVQGKVTAISGSTLTLTGKNNVSYTVNAGSAKIVSGPHGETASELTDIAVGDHIIAVGTVTDTNVSATTIAELQIPKGKAHGLMKKHR